MSRRLFLFQWDPESARARAEALHAAGWEVAVESEDGARGGNRVKAEQPAVVVLDLARRPSHSRETADGLRGLKATRQIPIAFVDGSEEAIAKTNAKVPNAIYTTSVELLQVLEQFAERGSLA